MNDVLPGLHQQAEADLLSNNHNHSNDLLWGADPIAAFASQIMGREVQPKDIYRWVDQGLLPVGHFGARLIGSKRTIADHIAALASQPAAHEKPVRRHSHAPQSATVRRRSQRSPKLPVGQQEPENSDARAEILDQLTAAAAPAPPGRTRASLHRERQPRRSTVIAAE